MFDVISALFWGVLFAVTTVPSWRILRRAGLSPWWSLLSFVPMIGTILILWIIAYRKWPNRNQEAPEAASVDGLFQSPPSDQQLAIGGGPGLAQIRSIRYIFDQGA
jgi:hypothetical protein